MSSLRLKKSGPIEKWEMVGGQSDSKLLVNGNRMSIIKRYKSLKSAIAAVKHSRYQDILFEGNALSLVRQLPSNCIDLIFSSPPYCMGKSYERSSSVDDFKKSHQKVLPELVRLLKPGGSICWQVGYHSDGYNLTPLDFVAHEIFSDIPDLRLRNRIVWTFAHGLHATKRFSGRHEVILWYTKGKAEAFDLDAIRVPQKYPGKKSYKGPNKGQLSGNPLGKNPGDVWEIPNVKGSHPEKTVHPCQFPVSLPQTFIRAVTPKNGLIFDPFMGVGSTGVAAAIEGRKFLGAEIIGSYVEVAAERVSDARSGQARYRPAGRPIFIPKPTDAVARKPAHFRG